MKKQNKQSQQTSVRRRGGAGGRNTVPRLYWVERHRRLVGLRGGGVRGERGERRAGRRGEAQGPREEKPGWGPLTQGGASGPERGEATGCQATARRPEAPAPCPSLRLAGNRGWE